LIRIPLVIVDPDRCTPGAQIDSLRSQLDLYHTLLDLAGIPPEKETKPPGSSLLDFQGKERIYIEANGSGGKKYSSRCYLRGARTQQWKYWRMEGGNENLGVLWDMENDPRETRNVIQDHPETAKALDQFVTATLESYPDRSGAILDEEKASRIEEKMRALGYL
jgi:arylsulfatase A-like enzyme